MKVKHTPGPWAWSYDADKDEITVSGGQLGCYVCSIDVVGEYLLGAWPEIDSDAHLIAAAPDLLEALCKWVELAERTVQDHATRFDANRLADFHQGLMETRAAIAKATGHKEG